MDYERLDLREMHALGAAGRGKETKKGSFWG